MNLTKDQKELLQSLVKHPGFTILERIEEDEANKLGRKIIQANLDDIEQVKILRENQIYAKARKDFLLAIKNKTGDIYEQDI